MIKKELHVLLIEDNPGDRMLISEYLRQELSSCQITEASSFEQADQLLKTSLKYDAILLDMKLPDLSEEPLVKSVLNLAGNIPVIVLTGFAQKDLGISILSMGVSDFLLKDEVTASHLYRSLMYSIERRTLNNEIANAAVRNEMVLQSMKDAYVLANSAGLLVDVNQAYCDMIGYSREELLRKNIRDLKVTQHDKEYDQLLEQMHKFGFLQFETEHRTKSGESLYMEMNVTVTMMNGQPLQAAFGRDITEKRRLQKQLIENEEKYKQIVENVPIISVTFDADGNVVYVSPNVQEITGLIEGEKEVQSLRESFKRIHPEDLTELEQEFQLFFDGKSSELYKECRFKHKNGNWIWLSIHFKKTVVIRNEKFHYGTISDITKRKEAELALLEREQHLRTVMDTEPECVKLLDRKGALVDMNRAGLKMIEADHLDVVKGQQITDLINEEYRAGFKKLTKEVFEGKTVNYEFTITGLKGTHRWLEMNAVPFKNTNGEITNLLGITRDVTERKKSESELLAAYEEVKQLKKQLQEENVYLQEELKLENNFEEIVFVGKPIQDVLKHVEQVATLDATVLILGETGTGKELIARAIHNLSERSSRPMIKVNCGALPKELIESELFGHERGAFTGATERKAGRFELADRGTLFLDEIGEMPRDLQVKLLRVLQEGEFERLGSTKTTKVNVRIIAATNLNIEEEVSSGKFREDLYYRLNVFPIILPPLRERKEDIDNLVKFFVNKYSKRYAKSINHISKEALSYLHAYNWPGNVRELQNVIERAIITSSDGTLRLNKSLETTEKLISMDAMETLTLEEVERSHIQKILERCDGVISGKSGAATILDIHPNTLRDRMKKLKIK